MDGGGRRRRRVGGNGHDVRDRTCHRVDRRNAGFNFPVGADNRNPLFVDAPVARRGRDADKVRDYRLMPVCRLLPSRRRAELYRLAVGPAQHHRVVRAGSVARGGYPLNGYGSEIG